MLKVIRSEVEYQSALADLDDLLEEDPRTLFPYTMLFRCRKSVV